MKNGPDPAILKLFARNYKTNEPLPVELAQKARAADDFGRALDVRGQMFYAAISLDFYNRDPRGLDQDQLVSQLQTALYALQVRGRHPHADRVRPSQRLLRRYYTYMWSLVIAKDMFTEFKKDGLLNPAVATKYRNSILGASGTKPAAEMIQDFLGRPYSFQAYADWLNGK